MTSIKSGGGKSWSRKFKFLGHGNTTCSCYETSLQAICDSLQQKVPQVSLHLCLIHKHYKASDSQYF